jgi:hypothetical protein
LKFQIGELKGTQTYSGRTREDVTSLHGLVRSNAS